MPNTPSLKTIWTIAWPIILGGISTHVVTVVDTAFLGRLGETALGGAGNAVILFLVFILAGSGLATGTQIIIGRKNGEEKFTEIGAFFQQAVVAVLGLATVFFLFSSFILPLFLPSLIQSNDVLAFVEDYIEMRSWGLFFNFINSLFIGLYIGLTKTLVISQIAPIIALVNVILDYGLIQGNLGLPAMGVKGAALASNLSELLGTLIFSWYTLRPKIKEKYQLGFRLNLALENQKVIWRISGPIILQNLISISSWFTFFLLVERMGERPLAISHIVRSIYVFLMIPVFALGNTTNTLVSNAMGKNAFGDVKPLLKRMLTLGILVAFALVPFLLFFDEHLIGLFTQNPELVLETIPTLRVVTVTLFSLTIGMILFFAVSGTGKTNVALFIEIANIICYLIYLFTTTHYLTLEVHQVWYAEFLYFGGLTLFSILFFKFYPWQRKSF